jgi:hypothetical protein
MKTRFVVKKWPLVIAAERRHLNSRGCSALARKATVPSESTTQPRRGDTSGFATDVALALVGTQPWPRSLRSLQPRLFKLRRYTVDGKRKRRPLFDNAPVKTSV